MKIRGGEAEQSGRGRSNQQATGRKSVGRNYARARSRGGRDSTIGRANIRQARAGRLGGRVSAERVGRRTDVWGRKSTTPFNSHLYTVLGVPTSADVKVQRR
ncbi:hypothetical protein BC826DRAFT_1081803 [Russula brevipes]|nr:hypothetical protein BC826DRAFT_1081803 [Russula brevipes]